MPQPHYYSEKQASPMHTSKIKVLLRGISFEFYTAPGVFSKKKIDNGTELLIEHAIIEDGWNVLDIGCGYGPIGIAVAKCFPNANVLMAEINTRALKLAGMNADLNRVKNVERVHSNLFDGINKKFNAILVNPPQSAGKKLCFEIIEKSKGHLEKNGLLQLVARRNKGGAELSKKMKEVFGNVKEIVKGSGYRVYVSGN